MLDEEDEASLPMESVVNGGRNINISSHSGVTTTVHTVRRKAAKRSESWYNERPSQKITVPFSRPPPQDEDIPVTKRRRLDPIIESIAEATNGVVYNDLCSDNEDIHDEKPKAKKDSSSTDVAVGTYAISPLLRKTRPPAFTATAEAATTTPSPDAAMALAPPTPPDEDVDDDANTDSATDAHSNPGATGVNRRWTLEEDAELTSAVAKTKKKKKGKEYQQDWAAIAKQVPGRTRVQCKYRWRNNPKHRFDGTAARTGKWTEDEYTKLKDAVHKHGGKDWAAITALVPGRTINQCSGRWRCSLNPSTKLTAEHTGTWTEDEDTKLKDAIHMHNDWAAIAELVPRRTKVDCWCRWHDHLKHIIDQVR
jgi:hypothetical protein